MREMSTNTSSNVIPVNSGVMKVYDMGLFCAFEDKINKTYKLFDSKIREGWTYVDGLIFDKGETSTIYIIGSDSGSTIIQHEQMLRRGEDFLLRNMGESYNDKRIRIVGDIISMERRLISLIFPSKYTAMGVSHNRIYRATYGYPMRDNREDSYYMFPSLLFQKTSATEVVISEVYNFVNSRPREITSKVEKRNFRSTPEKLYDRYLVGTEYDSTDEARAKVLRTTQQELSNLKGRQN